MQKKRKMGTTGKEGNTIMEFFKIWKALKEKEKVKKEAKNEIEHPVFWKDGS